MVERLQTDLFVGVKSDIFTLTEDQRLELQRFNREYPDRIRHRLENCQNPKLGL